LIDVAGAASAVSRWAAMMIQTGDSSITASHTPALERSSVSALSPDPELPDPFELVIRPQSGWIGINWKEMFSHRELLFFLIWRDITVRYKQTALGPAWAILQPLILMLIFTFVFGRFGKLDPQQFPFPYPVFVFAGLIPWTLFSQGMAQSAMSLVGQFHLLTKVYFPRLFVPIATACVFVVDLVISLGIYAFVLLYYRIAPSWTFVFVPLLVVLTLIATLGIGIMLSALTIFYRDFKHIVPFLTMIFMFVTPVIYPASVFRPRLQLILALNPMFGIVTAYRSAILGLPWELSTLAISTLSALVTFTVAVFYFRRTERRFADFI
jgi:lipopolysaccharide transport system permease protein